MPDPESLWCGIVDIFIFIRSLVPALLSICLGGFILNKFFIRRANMANCIDSLCKKIEVLSDECASYWSQDYSASKNGELKVQEAKIKGALLQLNVDYRFIAEEYKIPCDTIPAQMIELVDLCTGGQFESKKRKADIGRYLKIVNCLGGITVHLRSHKI